MTSSKKKIPVIDLFAGPGGLGEGFAVAGGKSRKSHFDIRLSIEKDKSAYNTLKLRSFFRKFPEGKAPKAYYDLEYRKSKNDFNYNDLYDQYPHMADETDKEVKHCELGVDSVSAEEIDDLIHETMNNCGNDHWVLIGGPPCQAYSTAGRSRNRGNKKYVPELDDRHFLYKEYLRIISEHWPSVFVMENVKGILTSRVNGRSIFKQILADLRNPAGAFQGRDPGSESFQYRIFSFIRQPDSFDADGFPVFRKPHDFIIECEKYGIPQARHRVILLGIREDLETDSRTILKKYDRTVTVSDVINGLPKLRSCLSGEKDSFDSWVNRIREIVDFDWFAKASRSGADKDVFDIMNETLQALGRKMSVYEHGAEVLTCKADIDYLPDWYLDKRMKKIFNTSTRKHQVEDLYRYLFASCFSIVRNRSPVLMDFPEGLLPEHRSAGKAVRSRSGNFADRFRVQVMDRPSTTVMSHISKDGHYYIHPDPSQCRSLTVREAARLQTFPDNYIFTGSRTQQYVQVGNAVPPLLAKKLAEIVLDILEGNKQMDILPKENEVGTCLES